MFGRRIPMEGGTQMESLAIYALNGIRKGGERFHQLDERTQAIACGIVMLVTFLACAWVEGH